MNDFILLITGSIFFVIAKFILIIAIIIAFFNLCGNVKKIVKMKEEESDDLLHDNDIIIKQLEDIKSGLETQRIFYKKQIEDNEEIKEFLVENIYKKNE